MAKDRICPICGTTFNDPNNAKTCINPVCRAEYKRQYQLRKTAERKEQKNPKRKKGSLDAKLNQAHISRTTYAELQKAETLRLYGKIEL